MDAHEQQPKMVACAVSRDLTCFDLLISELGDTLGPRWCDVDFGGAIDFLASDRAEGIAFIALTIDAKDEDHLLLLGNIIAKAKARQIKVMLIADDVSPAALHCLLRMGADEFVPYPLPQGELEQAIIRMRRPAEPAPKAATAPAKQGAIIAVQGLAGGTGATTLAVNLAWELAQTKDMRVCLMDFDLQFGAVATYLDLERPEAVYETLVDTATMDDESFRQSLLCYQSRLEVLTAPRDMLPLDLIGPEDIERLTDMARRHFDFVVIDMPSTVVQWSETVLTRADIYLATLGIDMRSAQNALRFRRALQAEELPADKLRYVINRAPSFTDLSGKARTKRMAETLGISLDVMLPEGGKQVMQSTDHGLPLAECAKKSPLRKEIAKLAASIVEVARQEG